MKQIRVIVKSQGWVLEESNPGISPNNHLKENYMILLARIFGFVKLVVLCAAFIASVRIVSDLMIDGYLWLRKKTESDK